MYVVNSLILIIIFVYAKPVGAGFDCPYKKAAANYTKKRSCIKCIHEKDSHEYLLRVRKEYNL